MAGLFLCGFLAFGIGVYSFTQLLEPLAKEFSWGRATLGGQMSAFWLSAPFSVIAAYSLRRMGVRGLLAVGGAIEIVGLLGMIWAHSATEFYVLRFLTGVGKVMIVTPIPVVSARCVPNRAGLAMAISFCGWHTGGLVMAPLTAELVIRFGWRSALVANCAFFAVGLAIALLLLRARSITEPSAEDPVATPPNDPATGSMREPIPGSRGALIAICIATLTYYAGYAGLLGQLAPLLTDAGFDEHSIGQLTGSVAISAALGVLLAGAVTQCVSAQTSGCIFLVLMSVATLSATLLGSGASLLSGIFFVALVGGLVGGGDPIIIDALRQSVDPQRFDRSYGWWYLLCLAALTIAPFAVGAVFDRFGTYRVGFLIISVATLASAPAWVALVRYPRKTASTVYGKCLSDHR
jgi:MFS family permease